MPHISTSFSTDIYYHKTGNGPVLVLLHGFPESSKLWEGIASKLSKTYTLIMPDFPGSGKSELKVSVSIDQMAQAVKAILDAEHIDKAVIAGHSMGGYVTFSFAKQYPDKIAGISLIHSTPAADDDEKKIMRRKAIEIIRKGGKQTFIRQMVTGLFSQGFKNTHPGVIEQQITTSLEVSEDGLVNYYNAMIERQDRTDVLTSSQFPIQWIVGEEDNVISFAKILPYCHQTATNFVSFYNECAHMAMFEAPEKLISDLQNFTDYCYKTS